jgi:hypothetical protein
MSQLGEQAQGCVSRKRIGFKAHCIGFVKRVLPGSPGVMKEGSQKQFLQSPLRRISRERTCRTSEPTECFPGFTPENVG